MACCCRGERASCLIKDVDFSPGRVIGRIGQGCLGIVSRRRVLSFQNGNQGVLWMALLDACLLIPAHAKSELPFALPSPIISHTHTHHSTLTQSRLTPLSLP